MTKNGMLLFSIIFVIAYSTLTCGNEMNKSCPKERPCLHISGGCSPADFDKHDGKGRGFCYTRHQCLYPDLCYQASNDECVCAGSRPCKQRGYPGYCKEREGVRCPYGSDSCVKEPCPKDKPCLHTSGACMTADKKVHDGAGRGFCYARSECIHWQVCYDARNDKCVCSQSRPCKQRGYPGYCISQVDEKCPYGSDKCTTPFQ